MQHSGHWLLRIFCSLHLLAVYAAFVGGLPGFRAILQPEQQKQLLFAIGLWHPSVAAGMLPLLALLLLVSCAVLYCLAVLLLLALLLLVSYAVLPCYAVGHFGTQLS